MSELCGSVIVLSNIVIIVASLLDSGNLLRCVMSWLPGVLHFTNVVAKLLYMLLNFFQ